MPGFVYLYKFYNSPAKKNFSVTFIYRSSVTIGTKGGLIKNKFKGTLSANTWKEVPTLAYRVIVKNGNAECIVNAVTGELIEEIPYYVT